MADVHVFKVIRHGGILIHRPCKTPLKASKCPQMVKTPKPSEFKRDRGQTGWAAVWETRKGQRGVWRWVEGIFHENNERVLEAVDIQTVLHFAEPPRTQQIGSKPK